MITLNKTTTMVARMIDRDTGAKSRPVVITPIELLDSIVSHYTDETNQLNTEEYEQHLNNVLIDIFFMAENEDELRESNLDLSELGLVPLFSARSLLQHVQLLPTEDNINE